MKISDHATGNIPPMLRRPRLFASSWQASIPHMALEKWENEGGRVKYAVVPEQPSAPPPQPRKDADDLAEQLRLMSDSLAQDYANGSVGQRFNTYAHRSRVIRQMTAELRKLEAAVAEEPQSARSA